MLITQELVRAIRRESALAITFWWGVRQETVWRWRLALGVIRLGPPGSERLLFLFREPGPATLRGQKVPLNFVRLRIYRRGKEEGKRRKQKKKGVGSR